MIRNGSGLFSVPGDANGPGYFTPAPKRLYMMCSSQKFDSTRIPIFRRSATG